MMQSAPSSVPFSRWGLCLRRVSCMRVVWHQVLQAYAAATRIIKTSMITLIQSLATGMYCSGCNEPLDMARNPLFVTGEDAQHDPLLGEPRVQDGDDDGDHADNRGSAMAEGVAGYGLNGMDMGAIVDGILADLPAPSLNHIFPEVEES